MAKAPKLHQYARQHSVFLVFATRIMQKRFGAYKISFVVIVWGIIEAAPARLAFRQVVREYDLEAVPLWV